MLGSFCPEAALDLGRFFRSDRVEPHDGDGEKKPKHLKSDQGDFHFPSGSLVQGRLLDLGRVYARWEVHHLRKHRRSWS